MDYLEDLKFAADYDCRNSNLMYASIFGIIISVMILAVIILDCGVTTKHSFSDYTHWIIGSSVFMGLSIVGFLSCPVKAVKKMNKEIKNTN